MGGTVRKVGRKLGIVPKRPKTTPVVETSAPEDKAQAPTIDEKEFAARRRARGTGRRTLLAGSLMDEQDKRTLG